MLTLTQSLTLTAIVLFAMVQSVIFLAYLAGTLVGERRAQRRNRLDRPRW